MMKKIPWIEVNNEFPISIEWQASCSSSYALIVETFYASGRKQLKKRVTETDADVILIQQHRSKGGGANELRAWFQARGWDVAIEERRGEEIIRLGEFLVIVVLMA